MENLSPEKKQAIEAAAKQAVMLIEHGMTVGLGTGRAAKIFIQELINRVKNDNLKIKCIATSLKSKAMIEGKLELIDESLIDCVDITFDGADRANPETLHLIKGGGGALLREKLVAQRSNRNIMLLDETKLVTPLGDFVLPVEIVEFGYKSTICRIEEIGFNGTLRKKPNSNEIATSDNGNYIFDINLETPIVEPSATHKNLKQVTGVIETGLFY